MAWIESHQTIKEHPKTKRLCRSLDISRPAAVGHLHMLWWWCLDYAPDGDLSSFDAGDIAEGAMYEGEPDLLLDALLSAGGPDKEGYLEQTTDGRLVVHDWLQFARGFMDARASAEQHKQQRSLYNNRPLLRAVRDRYADICVICAKHVDFANRRGIDGGTYILLDPDAGTNLENVAIACRECSISEPALEAVRRFLAGDSQIHADDSRKYVFHSALPNLTGPDRTLSVKPLTPSKGRRVSSANNPYSEEFERFWAAYPAIKDDKRATWVNWQARLNDKQEPVTAEQLIAAAERYAVASRATEPTYRKRPKTFLGPARPYEEYLPGQSLTTSAPPPTSAGERDDSEQFQRIKADMESEVPPEQAARNHAVAQAAIARLKASTPPQHNPLDDVTLPAEESGGDAS